MLVQIVVRCHDIFDGSAGVRLLQSKATYEQMLIWNGMNYAIPNEPTAAMCG